MNPLHHPAVHALRPRGTLGLILTMEMHDRLDVPIFGPPGLPKCLRLDLLSAYDYCLDAPEEIPAGAMRLQEWGPNDEDWLPMQQTISRDPESTEVCLF